MKNIILSLIAFSFLMSDIQFSGDARVRPRYDIKENGDGSSTSDLYYMYRARLNMKADIGDGWFFNTQLGTANTAGMTTMGVDEDITAWGPGNQNSNRPPVNFMQLYFGSMKDDWGFWAGAFPLKYNPSLDLHFYSDKLVDIPFVLFNNSSTTGFAGYKSMYGYKLNWFLSVDNNVTEREEPVDDSNDEPIDDCDDFTLGIDAQLTFGSVSVTPRLLTSFGGTDDDIYPTTFGADILLPEVAGFNSSFSYHLSTNGEEGDDGYYEADHMRLSLSRKIKEGKLKFFYDMASVSNAEYNQNIDLNNDGILNKDNDQVSFLWLSYTHTCYKGDMGEVTLSPTLRLQNGKGAGTDSFDEDYSRSKFEVTAQIKFK
jgi:hypothetical protein